MVAASEKWDLIAIRVTLRATGKSYYLLARSTSDTIAVIKLRLNDGEGESTWDVAAAAVE